MDAIVGQWFDSKVIENTPDDCANCFPILTVPKKNAYSNKFDIRPCINLRRLNSRLKYIDYPLPGVQEILDNVGSQHNT